MLIQGPDILDEAGRTLLLRGCNLGGSSKLPAGYSQTAGQGGARDAAPEDVSFVGRPFPLEEAEGHFRRMRDWGFTLIRLVVPWEALEHAGPGLYDEAYLAYLRKLLLAAEKEGVSVFIDPHQDVWSRWTGGDGAPAWTLEKLGMDLSALDETGAAVTRERAAVYPPMIWPSNYNRYGAATLFTLFFAGNVYAPEVQVEGESAQDFLQNRYFACMRHAYRRLKNCRALAGWGTMNEPHPGFIGCRDLSGLENCMLALGPMPSAFQGMAAASGHRVTVPVCKPWPGGRRETGKQALNPRGVSLWKPGFACPWKQAGIWTDEGGGEARLLRKDHFALYQGRQVNFTNDFLKPFILKFIERMKEAERPCIFFIEGVPGGQSESRHPAWGKDDPKDTVNAFHHYDGATLFTKMFFPAFNMDPVTSKLILGRKKNAAFYASSLAEAKAWTRERMGDMPCLLGEFGLPFDLNHGKAWKKGGPAAYRLHEQALSLYYDGIDGNLLHSLIWNYTPDNTHAGGDHWNGEDLSIVSLGDGPAQAGGLAEARAMGGWLRPYPMAVAGKPLGFRWDRKAKVFRFRFIASPAVQAPTEIFAPPECFGEKAGVTLALPGRAGQSGETGKLRAEYSAAERRIFIYNEGFAGEVEITARGTPV